PTLPRLPSSTLFPYTTLFRSGLARGSERQASRVMEALAEVGELPVAAAAADEGDARRQSVRAQARGHRERRLIEQVDEVGVDAQDRKSTRLNSSHDQISYAVF